MGFKVPFNQTSLRFHDSVKTPLSSAAHLQVSPAIKTRMAQISSLFQKSLMYREAIFTTPSPSGSYRSCWEEKRGWV